MNRYIALVTVVAASVFLAGCGGGSGGGELPPVPEIEADSLVAVQDSSGIQLTWNASTDDYAVGSMVYYSTDGGTAYDDGTSVGAAQNYTFNGAAFTFGVNYTFKLTTYNSARVESDGITTPAEVSDLTVDIVGVDAMVDWTSSSDADEYMVYYSLDDGATFDAGTSAGTDTDLTLIGIAGAANYIFKVVVIETDDVGNDSISAGATTPLDVTGFVAASGDTNVTLTWAASATLDATSYKVYLKEASGAYDNGTEVVSGEIITGLDNGTIYTVRLVTVDSNGDESPGRRAMFIPTSADDNVPPTDGAELRVTSGDTEVILDWDPATDGVIAYNIYVDENADGGWVLDPVSPLNIGDLTYTAGGFPTYTVTGLTNGTPYAFLVTALDSQAPPNESAGITATATPGSENVMVLFDPPGGVYNWEGAGQPITLTGSVAGTIYYTIDGSNPTTASPSGASPLVTPFNVDEDITIKAFLIGIPVGGPGITVTHQYRIYSNAAFPADTYKQFSGMLYQRRYCTAEKRIDGTVIFIGGKDPRQPLDSSAPKYIVPSEYYDHQNDYFIAGGDLPALFRDHRSATLIDDTTVLVCGGRMSIYPSTARNQAYVNPEVGGTCDPGTNATTIVDVGVGAQPIVVGDFVTITSGNARGARAKITVIVDANTLTTQTLSPVPDLADADDDDYVIGYNFTATAGNMATPRFYHTVTRLYSGNVLVAGGISGVTKIDISATTDDGSGIIKGGSGLWVANGVQDGDIVEIADVSIATRNAGALALDAVAGASTITVTDGAPFEKDQCIIVDDDNFPAEYHVIDSKAGDVLTFRDTVLGNSFAIVNSAFAAPKTGIGLVSDKDMSTIPPQITLLGYTDDIDAGVIYSIVQGAVDSAEVYDAAAETFGGAVGLMKLARFGHTATLLENGEVFLAGGVYDYEGNPDNDMEFMTELYDPDTSTFKWAGSGNSAYLSTIRFFHAATRLKDGKVLITGGLPSPVGTILFNNLFSSTPMSSAQRFNPDNETMSDAGSMVVKRFMHTSTLLQDGRVLITGGIINVVDNDKAVYVDSAEIYDPSVGATGEFSAVGNLLEPRFGHSAVLLDNGNVLIGGGLNTSLPELFLPGRDIFVATASCMSGDRYIGSTATLLDDDDASTNKKWEGRVLVSGGQRKNRVDSNGDDVEGYYLATAETYDSAALEFTYTTSSMADARKEHTSTRLDDGNPGAPLAWEGKVLIAGGYNGVGLIGAELYDPEDDFDGDALTPAFAATGDMSRPRYGHTATLFSTVAGGTFVLVAGGGADADSCESADIYDPTDGAYGSFGSTGNNMLAVGGRFHHAAIRLLDGRILITGGGEEGTFDDTAEIYDPEAGPFGSFTLLPAVMTWGRDGHDMALLPGADGDVLIVGGTIAGVNAEVFDTVTETFIVVTNAMVAGHYGHTVTPLLDGPGRILISSGDNIGTGEYFTYVGEDPALATFTIAVGGLDGTQPWEHHSAVRLQNGSVLLMWEHVAQVFFPN